MSADITYVFPVYNEEENIPVLFRELSMATSMRPDLEFEFLFVDDGSRDGSGEQLLLLEAADERVRVVRLSRNFGHQAAVTAGLDRASGRAAIIMDADLQDPPHVSLDLIAHWEEGWDVVYAERRTRSDTVFKRATADAFYRVLTRVAEVEIPRNVGDFRLVDRSVIDALAGMREHDRFLRGMVAWVGFRQTAVLFDRPGRRAGESGYPIRRMIKFALDGIFGFSTAPIRMISYVGYLISVLALVGVVYAILMRILAPDVTISGWTFTIIAILFIGGVQLVLLGILGSYIARIYIECQNRPLYLVREPRER